MTWMSRASGVLILMAPMVAWYLMPLINRRLSLAMMWREIGLHGLLVFLVFFGAMYQNGNRFVWLLDMIGLGYLADFFRDDDSDETAIDSSDVDGFENYDGMPELELIPGLSPENPEAVSFTDDFRNDDKWLVFDPKYGLISVGDRKALQEAESKVDEPVIVANVNNEKDVIHNDKKVTNKHPDKASKRKS